MERCAVGGPPVASPISGASLEALTFLSCSATSDNINAVIAIVIWQLHFRRFELKLATAPETGTVTPTCVEHKLGTGITMAHIQRVDDARQLPHPFNIRAGVRDSLKKFCGRVPAFNHRVVTRDEMRASGQIRAGRAEILDAQGDHRSV